MEQQDLDIIIKSVINHLEELKAENIEIIDLEKKNFLFTKAILATGNSSRHILSMADNIGCLLKQKYRILTRSEGHFHSEWILIDAKRLIINIFQEDAREKYNLIEVWKK